jgi:predicted nucleotidyltransferase
MTDMDFLAGLRSAAVKIFADQDVLAAYAFGSRISGHPSIDSDLDVGYYLTGYRKGARLSIREEMLLAANLSRATGLEVDLRNLAEAPLELRGRVLEEGIRIYSGNDPERVELECNILARYHDYKDIFRQMHETRIRAVAARGL